MISKLVSFLGTVIGLLIMLFSAPLSYLAGTLFLYSPFWNSVREEIHIPWFFVGAALQLGAIFLTVCSTATGLLIWYLCKQYVQTLRAYLWVSATLGSLAVVMDIVLFAILGLLGYAAGATSPTSRFLPGELDLLVYLFLFGVLFLGHAIFAALITRYHWRLIYRQNKASRG